VIPGGRRSLSSPLPIVMESSSAGGAECTSRAGADRNKLCAEVSWPDRWVNDCSRIDAHPGPVGPHTGSATWSYVGPHPASATGSYVGPHPVKLGLSLRLASGLGLNSPSAWAIANEPTRALTLT